MLSGIVVGLLCSIYTVVSELDSIASLAQSHTHLHCSGGAFLCSIVFVYFCIIILRLMMIVVLISHPLFAVCSIWMSRYKKTLNT